METAVSNWGAIVSLPAAIAVIYVVVRFIQYNTARDKTDAEREEAERHERDRIEAARAVERDTFTKTLDKVVEGQKQSLTAQAAGLKENTDSLSAMAVTLATTVAHCQSAQGDMSRAAGELRRRASDVPGAS